MRIDKLTIRNFKKFVEQEIEFHKQFTLLVGENGAGKTSVLDALAVAIGLWHKVAPGSGWRNIFPGEIKLEPVLAGDRVQFIRKLPTSIQAEGRIGQKDGLTWTRMIKEGGTRTTNAKAREAEQAIIGLSKAAQEHAELLPVLAYYGAGRAWLPTNTRPSARTSLDKTLQFDAYHQCLGTHIRDKELNEWVLFETAASNGQGAGRPGFRAVKQAVLGCIPGADGLRFDADLKEIVLSISGNEQPFYNLSAGQRMMLALVADIAIKAVTLNSYLYGPSQAAANDPQKLLELTPGIVLIDELDVHLHPSWQRRVATDLKRTFPAIQFVCTSHSPQVIGELQPNEIRILDSPQQPIPAQSFGMDSNWILEVLMKGERRDSQINAGIERMFKQISEKDLEQAEQQLDHIRSETGETEDLMRAAATIKRIRLLGK